MRTQAGPGPQARYVSQSIESAPPSTPCLQSIESAPPSTPCLQSIESAPPSTLCVPVHRVWRPNRPDRAILERKQGAQAGLGPPAPQQRSPAPAADGRGQARPLHPPSFRQQRGQLLRSASAPAAAELVVQGRLPACLHSTVSSTSPVDFQNGQSGMVRTILGGRTQCV
jgi:hypothetical protein